MVRFFTKPFFLLGVLMIIGAFLRVYNLNWGAPYYFHPDERNIASSVTQLSFPDQLNPHFFAYGSLPIYTIFFLGLITNIFDSCQGKLTCPVTFEAAIVIGRIVASFFAVLLIPLSYFVSEKVLRNTGLLTATLTTFSTGYIQFAHFGTVEMWLTFFTLLFFLSSLLSMQKTASKWHILSGVFLGILVSAKISSVVLVSIPLIIFFIKIWIDKQKVLSTLAFTSLTIIVTACIFLATNPFVYRDFPAFKASMDYESGVGLGTIPVFYTGEFINSIPLVFQFIEVYPFLLNVIVLLFFLISMVALLPRFYKNKQLLLIFIFFCITFFSQAFLYVKWTRYLVPTLPFIYILTAYYIHSQKLRRYFSLVIILSSMLFSLSYFITAYIEPDTRIEATNYAKNTIPANATILSEVYDLGIIPFNSLPFSVILYNFYELDTGNPEYTLSSLQSQLQTTEYVILPSQRLLKTRIQNADAFPVGNNVYKEFNNPQRFQKIYESPCSLFCRITYLGDPTFRFEGTASVFERPVVNIYKKL